LPHDDHPTSPLSAEERDLGMDRAITRRDFVNAIAAGTGAALLGGGTAAPVLAQQQSAPWHPWTGYGGVGDYAISNGNTWEVITAGHDLRDKRYERTIADAPATGETYDLVIVGGGFAGVIAAYTFLKQTGRRRSCLILDNHPLLGGEAKRNEFLVRGQRLIGPQGSNEFEVPKSTWRSEMWDDVGLPREFEWGKLPPGRRPLEFPRTNYDYLVRYWDPSRERRASHGYFFETPHPRWVTDPWGRGFEGTPWPADLRRDLLRWRDEPIPPFQGDQASLERWLDSMTRAEYLTKFLKLHPGVARIQDPLLVSGVGPASDLISAYLPYFIGMPGYKGLGDPGPREAREGHAAYAGNDGTISFPGGNDGILRAVVKWLNPELIEGSTAFAEVHNGRIRLEAMDRPGIPCRMRAGATVIRLVHDPEAMKGSKPATITYLKAGKLQSVRGRTVIWAGSSWTGQHAVQNLPPEYRTAAASFPRSPMLVANVALDNWRALYRLGYTACFWEGGEGGFGCTANIRAPMYLGDYRPPLDPDQPIVLTFYVPFPELGLPPPARAPAARAKLFATSYREYELQIRRQLVKLFGSAGLEPGRDVAGIVLNRWGHAYVNAGPGFFFGRAGSPAPRDVLRRPLGNLTFAHSEFAGLQLWDWAGEEGVRAARQVLAMLG
jgi:spermidine dehydrogenase